MVYFCFLWVRRNNPNYLAAALVTWSVGMYVDMVLAPVAFVFPALWLIYRPKLKTAPLVVTSLIVLVVWFPYLRFQRGRDFADLKALVQRHKIPSDYKASWCMPTLELKPVSVNASDTLAPPLPSAASLGFPARFRRAGRILKEGVIFNFDQMVWTRFA